ncbi:hypothetical protein Droror1_Dr00021515 [Drosera rotundifolia]
MSVNNCTLLLVPNAVNNCISGNYQRWTVDEHLHRLWGSVFRKLHSCKAGGVVQTDMCIKFCLSLSFVLIQIIKSFARIPCTIVLVDLVKRDGDGMNPLPFDILVCKNIHTSTIFPNVLHCEVSIHS